MRMGNALAGPGSSRFSTLPIGALRASTVCASWRKPSRISAGVSRATSRTPAAATISRNLFAYGSSGTLSPATTRRCGRSKRVASTPQGGDKGVYRRDRPEVRRRNLDFGDLQLERRLDGEHEADHVQRREADGTKIVVRRYRPI